MQERQESIETLEKENKKLSSQLLSGVSMSSDAASKHKIKELNDEINKCKSELQSLEQSLVMSKVSYPIHLLTHLLTHVLNYLLIHFIKMRKNSGPYGSMIT
jgi:uncharacterized protein (DUF342 family)